VGGRALGSGTGRSKKVAEQHAAEAAWNAISAEISGRNGGTAPPTPDP
jgi:ribonuclease-3